MNHLTPTASPTSQPLNGVGRAISPGPVEASEPPQGYGGLHSLVAMIKTILEGHQSGDVKLGETGDPLQFIQTFFLEMFLPFEQFKHVRTEIKRTGCVHGEFFEISNKCDMSFFVIAQHDWRGESTSVEEIEPGNFLRRGGLNPNKQVVDLDGAGDTLIPFKEQSVTTSIDVGNSRSTLIQFSCPTVDTNVPSIIKRWIDDDQLDRMHVLSIHIQAEVSHHIVVVQQFGTFYEIDDGDVQEIQDIVGYIASVDGDSSRTIQCGIFNIEGMDPDDTAGS